MTITTGYTKNRTVPGGASAPREGSEFVLETRGLHTMTLVKRRRPLWINSMSGSTFIVDVR